MCVCTEPVRTGIGAVCVDYGRPTWPITMLNHTDIPGTEKCFDFLFLAPYARTTRYEEAFCPRQKTVSVASLPWPCPIILNFENASFEIEDIVETYL